MFACSPPRSSALPALQSDEVEREIARWIAVMGTSDEGERFAAMQNLTRIGEPALPHGPRSARRPRGVPVRRWQAAMTAGSIGGDGVSAALLEALRTDPASVVARVAADQLGRVAAKACSRVSPGPTSTGRRPAFAR